MMSCVFKVKLSLLPLSALTHTWTLRPDSRTVYSASVSTRIVGGGVVVGVGVVVGAAGAGGAVVGKKN